MQNRAITEFFTQKNKSPFVYEIIRGASKANLHFKSFGILQKLTNAALTLNGEKRIGIFRQIGFYAPGKVCAVLLVEIFG